jgi:hypothetical protein
LEGGRETKREIERGREEEREERKKGEKDARTNCVFCSLRFLLVTLKQRQRTGIITRRLKKTRKKAELPCAKCSGKRTSVSLTPTNKNKKNKTV